MPFWEYQKHHSALVEVLVSSSITHTCEDFCFALWDYPFEFFKLYADCATLTQILRIPCGFFGLAVNMSQDTAIRERAEAIHEGSCDDVWVTARKRATENTEMDLDPMLN